MTTRENGWEIIGNKIKISYENLEWKQVATPYDLTTELDKAKIICGESINSCWLDSLHYTGMKVTPVTRDVYLFITHRAQAIREGIQDNFYYGINTEYLKNSINSLLSLDLNMIISILENLITSF